LFGHVFAELVIALLCSCMFRVAAGPEAPWHVRHSCVVLSWYVAPSRYGSADAGAMCCAVETWQPFGVSVV
jgi:hypothetical protein